MRTERCQDCGEDFAANTEAFLCPRCQADEDLLYANDPLPVDMEARKWSRRWMQEYLGVIGDTDD